MIGDLLWRKAERHYPTFLYRVALDMFALVQYWNPLPTPGSQRGRHFEGLFYEYCRRRGLSLSETSGSQTVRGQRSASGFRHESDAVIATPELTVHLELKHLGQAVSKNDLIIFNQKGLDFLASTNATLRRLPFYRVLLSGSPLTPEARAFALQWGILGIEPGRMPLVTLHWLAGQSIPELPPFARDKADEIWKEVPMFFVPFQQRLKRLAALLDGPEPLVSPCRLDRMTSVFQRRCGDEYWGTLDRIAPNWLGDIYGQVLRGCGYPVTA